MIKENIKDKYLMLFLLTTAKSIQSPDYSQGFGGRHTETHWRHTLEERNNIHV